MLSKTILERDEQRPHQGHAGCSDSRVNFNHSTDCIGDALPGDVWLLDLVGEDRADDTCESCNDTETKKAVELDLLAFREAHVPKQQYGKGSQDDIRKDGEDF